MKKDDIKIAGGRSFNSIFKEDIFDPDDCDSVTIVP